MHTHTRAHVCTHTHTQAPSHMSILSFWNCSFSSLEDQKLKWTLLYVLSILCLSCLRWFELLLSIAVLYAMASHCMRDNLAGLGVNTSLCLFLCSLQLPVGLDLILSGSVYICFMGSLNPLLSPPTPPTINPPPLWFQWQRLPTVAQKMFSVCYTWIKGV